MASSLSSRADIIGVDLLSDSATALTTVGAYAETPDGRGFRYVRNGVTATVAGRIYEAAAQDTTNFQNLTIVNAAVGDTQIVTTTTVTLTAAQCADLVGGMLVVTAATLGSGRAYKIKSVAAVTTAAATFKLEDPVAVATTGTATIDVHPNPYSGVIITPAGTATSAVVGVSTYPITASQFGWLQTHGAAPVLSSTAMTIGNNVMPLFATTAGAGTLSVDGVKPAIGFALTGIATTDVGLVFLTID